MPRAQAKLFQRHKPLALRTSDAALCAIGKQGWQSIAGWRGIADIPPNGGQIANLYTSKCHRRLGQGRIVCLDERMAFQRANRHQRAQAEPSVRAITDLVQSRDALDVEHISGLPDPLAPAYQDVGRPGNNSCAFLLAHHLDGLLHCLGFPVFEAVHRRSPIFRRSLYWFHPIILPMWTRYNRSRMITSHPQGVMDGFGMRRCVWPQSKEY